MSSRTDIYYKVNIDQWINTNRMIRNNVDIEILNSVCPHINLKLMQIIPLMGLTISAAITK